MSSEKSTPDPTDLSLPLNERVQAARELTGKGVRAFAKELGISHVALLKIENGKTNLLHHKSLGTLLKLVGKLKTDFGEAWLRPFLRLSTLTPEEIGLLEEFRRRRADGDADAIHRYLALSEDHRKILSGTIDLIPTVPVPEGKVLTFVPRLVRKRASG